MFGKIIIKTAAVATCALVAISASPAFSYQIFFGEDLNNSASAPLNSFANASAAEDDFLGGLMGVGTETFETFSSGAGEPLALSFPGAGAASLTGGRGSVDEVSRGSTNGYGRYATSGSKFWEVAAGGNGNFVVEFNESVAAFGFFGIDIGDFGGQLMVRLNDQNDTVLTVNNSIGSWGSTDGSVLFFGIIAEAEHELFSQASFETTTGQGDYFAFDDMTVGSRLQVNDPNINPTAVSEPTAIALLCAGLGCIGFIRLRQES